MGVRPELKPLRKKSLWGEWRFQIEEGRESSPFLSAFLLATNIEPSRAFRYTTAFGVLIPCKNHSDFCRMPSELRGTFRENALALVVSVRVFW